MSASGMAGSRNVNDYELLLSLSLPSPLVQLCLPLPPFTIGFRDS